MIKNRTPYLGKILLKFEKYPNYSGRSVLNKVHLNLGFTKLVSRMEPYRGEEGFQIDPKKIELIEMYTEGKIGPHKFGPGNEYELHNAFLTHDDRFIGNIEDAWWYFQNGMTVCDEYPHGVAIVWRTAKSDKTIVSGTDGVAGYYGYTHRGGCLFRIGDRIFEESYEPQPHHYTDEEWFKYVNKRRETQAEYDREGINERVTMKSVMPFNLRGERTIRNWGDALEAAKNLSKHLS